MARRRIATIQRIHTRGCARVWMWNVNGMDCVTWPGPQRRENTRGFSLTKREMEASSALLCTRYNLPKPLSTSHRSAWRGGGGER